MTRMRSNTITQNNANNDIMAGDPKTNCKTKTKTTHIHTNQLNHKHKTNRANDNHGNTNKAGNPNNEW